MRNYNCSTGVENLETSERDLSGEVDKLKSHQKCLKNNKFYPYYLQLNEELNENDCDKNIPVCH